nr:DUF6453 family protein [Pseudomonas sp. P97.38]
MHYADYYYEVLLMAYGLTVLNDSGLISIDSEFARLCVMQSGSYTQSVSIQFSPTITSQEPPLFFIRPNNNGGVVNLGCRFSGSAGNWTGVTVVSNSSTTGSYFVATFSPTPKSGYGMRLWNSAGGLIFDSGSQPAVFSRFAQNWTYETSTLDDQGYYINWYSIPMIAAGEYLLINNAGMRMVAGNVRGRSTSIYFDFSLSKLWFTTTALSNPFAFSLPAVLAKLTA